MVLEGASVEFGSHLPQPSREGKPVEGLAAALVVGKDSARLFSRESGFTLSCIPSLALVPLASFR